MWDYRTYRFLDLSQMNMYFNAEPTVILEFANCSFANFPLVFKRHFSNGTINICPRVVLQKRNKILFQAFNLITTKYDWTTFAKGSTSKRYIQPTKAKYSRGIHHVQSRFDSRAVLLILFPRVTHYQSGWSHRDSETFAHAMIPIIESS